MSSKQYSSPDFSIVYVTVYNLLFGVYFVLLLLFTQRRDWGKMGVELQSQLASMVVTSQTQVLGTRLLVLTEIHGLMISMQRSDLL